MPFVSVKSAPRYAFSMGVFSITFNNLSSIAFWSFLRSSLVSTGGAGLSALKKLSSFSPMFAFYRAK